MSGKKAKWAIIIGIDVRDDYPSPLSENCGDARRDENNKRINKEGAAKRFLRCGSSCKIAIIADGTHRHQCLATGEILRECLDGKAERSFYRCERCLRSAVQIKPQAQEANDAD